MLGSHMSLYFFNQYTENRMPVFLYFWHSVPNLWCYAGVAFFFEGGSFGVRWISSAGNPFDCFRVVGVTRKYDEKTADCISVCLDDVTCQSCFVYRSFDCIKRGAFLLEGTSFCDQITEYRMKRW